MKTTNTIIIYTFRKTGAPFTLVKIDETEGKAVIKDEEGKLHLVSLNTLKKNYKKSEQTIEIETKDESKTKTNKPSGKRKNIKGDINSVGKDEVIVKAFTGMVIGVFKVTKRNSKSIIIKTAKGELKFDAQTGLQINANNPKFANRIEV